MNYATIKQTDVANGPVIRVSLFVSGCTHRCKRCFNSEAWDFRFGQRYTRETEEEVLEALAPDYIRGLSLLGGEPMEPENRGTVLSLLQTVRQRYPGRISGVIRGIAMRRICWLGPGRSGMHVPAARRSARRRTAAGLTARAAGLEPGR